MAYFYFPAQALFDSRERKVAPCNNVNISSNYSLPHVTMESEDSKIQIDGHDIEPACPNVSLQWLKNRANLYKMVHNLNKARSSAGSTFRHMYHVLCTRLYTTYVSARQFITQAPAEVEAVARTVRQRIMELCGDAFHFLGSIISNMVSNLMVQVAEIVGDFLGVDFSWLKIGVITCAMVLTLIISSSTRYGPIVKVVSGILFGIILFAHSSFPIIPLGALTMLFYFKPNEPDTSVTTNVYVTPQGADDHQLHDLKEVTTSVINTTALLISCFAGVSIPTNVVALEKLLQRMALVQRSVPAVENVIDRVLHLFDSLFRVIAKYVLGDDSYKSMYHIDAVETLIVEVTSMMSLKRRQEVGSCVAQMRKVESLYLEYMRLRKMYVHDKKITEKLNIVSPSLCMIYKDIVHKNPEAQVMRKEPVCIAFHGSSGVGKTHIMQAMQHDLLKIAGVYEPGQSHEGHIYSRCQEQKFWDGYMGQRIVIIDDFGQQVDSQVNPNLDFFELIRGCNIFPWQLHCAALNEKANNAFAGEFICLTTNLPLDALRVPSMTSREAVLRRIHLPFEVSVIPELQFGCGPNPKGLDVEKLRQWRYDHGKSEFDTSHWIFTMHGKAYTYEQMIVLVSKVYKKHYEAYELRVRLSESHKSKKLPSNCFSLDQQWTAQGTTSFMHLPLFNDIQPAFCGYYEKTVEVLSSLYETSYARFLKYALFGMGVVMTLRTCTEFFQCVRNMVGTVTPVTCNVEYDESQIRRHNRSAKQNVRANVEHVSTKSRNAESDESSIQRKNRSRVKAGITVESDENHLQHIQRLRTNKGKQIRPEAQVVHFPEVGRSVPVTHSRDAVLNEIFEPLLNPHAYFSQVVETIEPKLRQCMYELFVRYEDQECYLGTIFLIRGRQALCNLHYLEKVAHLIKTHNWDMSKVVLSARAPGMSGGHESLLSKVTDTAIRIRRGETETEFFLITLSSSLPTPPDVLKHMITRDELSKLQKGMRLLLFSWKHSTSSQVNRDGRCLGITTVEMENPFKAGSKHYANSITYDMSTAAGDCGAPLVLASDVVSHRLLGFHFAGAPGLGCSALITREDIEKIMEPALISADTTQVTPQACEKFPLRGSFTPIGTTQHPVNIPVKSKILPSELYGIFPVETCPALLSRSLDVDKPLIKGLMKNASDVRVLDEDIIDQSLLEYQNLLFESAPLEHERTILSFEEACMGIPGNDYIKPLTRTKSAGWPFSLSTDACGKTKWLGKNDWDFHSQEAQFLRSVVGMMEVQMRQGIIPEAYFVDTLKDECRPIDKVKEGKTRVFSACPITLSILYRKYFAGFLAFVARRKIDVECCVGTNVYSYDWTRIANRLTTHPNILAGDFANFDGTVQFNIFHKLVDIVNRFYDDGETNCRVRKVIWDMICKSKHILLDIVYQFSHGQPSGNPGTAVFNSIYVSVAMRCVWNIHFREHEMYGKFGVHCALVDFGDDWVVAVSDIARELIKPRDFARGFEALHMKVTAEDKQPLGSEYKSLRDVTFLKRQFICDARYNRYFAPLSLTSIHSMVMWNKTGKDDNEITKSNVEGAIEELSLHPREIFEEDVRVILRACKEKDILVSHLPWEETRRRLFLNNQY